MDSEIIIMKVPEHRRDHSAWGLSGGRSWRRDDSRGLLIFSSATLNCPKVSQIWLSFLFFNPSRLRDSAHSILPSSVLIYPAWSSLMCVRATYPIWSCFQFHGWPWGATPSSLSLQMQKLTPSPRKGIVQGYRTITRPREWNSESWSKNQRSFHSTGLFSPVHAFELCWNFPSSVL